MRAGKLRHRIAIQIPNEVENGPGEVVKTWATVDTVWASIEQVTKRQRDSEGVAGLQVQAVASHIIGMRYHSAVTAISRFVFGTRIFNVASIENVDQRNISLAVYVEEEV